MESTWLAATVAHGSTGLHKINKPALQLDALCQQGLVNQAEAQSSPHSCSLCGQTLGNMKLSQHDPAQDLQTSS